MPTTPATPPRRPPRTADPPVLHSCACDYMLARKASGEERRRMGHGHGTSFGPTSASGRHLRVLSVALGIGAGFLLVEAAVGVATSSLALLSDAAHMLTDVLGLAMAL